MFSMIVLAIPVIILFVIIFAAITMMYVKASPNRAIILSGLRREPRFLIGQGGIKIPALERADYLYLGQISVDIKTGQSVPTNDFINVRVDAGYLTSQSVKSFMNPHTQWRDGLFLCHFLISKKFNTFSMKGEPSRWKNKVKISLT